MSANDPFELWLSDATDQLVALQEAGETGAWNDLNGLVEAFQLHLESRPPGDLADLAAATRLFTEARSVVDSLMCSAESAMGVTDGEIRELYRGRKALEAYR